MKQEELEAIKRILAEEFGLTGIEDPDELRLLAQAKFSEMNVLDRAAIQMRLGSILNEMKSGEPPMKSQFPFLAYIVLAVIGWFIWRPLAVILAVFAISRFRYLVIRDSLFWSPRKVLAIGGIYGIALAILIKIAAVFTVHSLFGEFIFGLFGFLASGYIGHKVVPTKTYLRMPRDEKLFSAQIAAIGGYLIMIVVLFVGPLFLPNN